MKEERRHTDDHESEVIVDKNSPVIVSDHDRGVKRLEIEN
jgi:hypothetical protein